MEHFKEIRSAQKRSISMGSAHGWRPEFDAHPLAACIANHIDCIDVELGGKDPDCLSIMFWILNMARKINSYCDAHVVMGSEAAQYWLERFLWRVDRIIDWSAFDGVK